MSDFALPAVPLVRELLARWEDRPHLDPDDAAAWQRDLSELRAKMLPLIELELTWDEDAALSGNSPTAASKPSSIP